VSRRAGDALRRGTLVPILPGWSLPTVDISLIYPRSRLLTPRVRALVHYLRDHVRPSNDAFGG
jgi:DNA-binding transcriptional LysR family regulator